MAGQGKAKIFLIGVLALLTIASGIGFLNEGPSGLVVGIPSTCKSTVNFEAPEQLSLKPGELKDISVVITEVSCGVSYVRLSLNGIPKEFYSVAPIYIGVISPASTPQPFVIYFDMPASAEGKSYTGIYTIYTNEGTFTFGELTVDVSSVEKPARPVVSMKSTEQVPESVARVTWYGVLFFASLAMLILLGYEYFLYTRSKEMSSALKRKEGGLSRALHTSPKKSKSFESALKKSRKKR